MTDPRAAEIIDNLIVLLSFGEEGLADYNVVDHGLAYLIETRREYPEHPITIRIWNEIVKRGIT